MPNETTVREVMRRAAARHVRDRLKIDPDIAAECGMDGNAATLLQEARDMDRRRSRVHVTLPDGTVVGEHGSRAIAERAINRVYAVRHHGPFEVREGPAPKTARWV